MKRTLLILSVLFVSLYSKAQTNNSYKTIIYFHPTDALLKLDGELVSTQEKGIYQANLAEGEHILELWHPHFQSKTDTLFIEAKNLNKHNTNLRKTRQEYINYSSDLRQYKQNKFYKTSLTILLPVVNAAALLYVSNNQHKDELDALDTELQMLAQAYNTAVMSEEVQMYRRRYELKRNTYNELADEVNKKRKIGIPAVIISSSLSYLILRKIHKKKRERPSYQAPAPFAFQSISINPVSSTTALSLNINF